MKNINEIFNEFKLIDMQISNNLKVVYGKHEVWRTIKNYDNYSVSSFGRVRNDKFNRFLKPRKNGDGYYDVGLYKKGKQKTYLISRLVAITFLPNHDQKPIVDHVDSKQITNNNISNLRWSTISQNGFNRDKPKNNTTNFKGVSFNKSRQNYEAMITNNKKRTFLGSFLTAEDASEAYEAKAKLLHKEFYYKNKLII